MEENLLGLSIGMSVAILIFYFMNFEMSYDDFHKEGKLRKVNSKLI